MTKVIVNNATMSAISFVKDEIAEQSFNKVIESHNKRIKFWGNEIKENENDTVAKEMLEKCLNDSFSLMEPEELYDIKGYKLQDS